MPRKAKIGATRDSHIYRVRVPATLQEQWEAWCAKTDKKPSEVMRALMRYMIQDDMPPEVRDWSTTALPPGPMQRGAPLTDG